MRPTFPLCLGIAALTLLLSSGCGRKEKAQVEEESAKDFGEGHARARLIADVDSLTPGQDFHIGVHFEIEKGWHLYWDGRNDTGLPISAEISVPDGFESGGLLWPAPERHVSPGGILDHIYEDRVTLLLPLRVPEEVEPGDRFTFTANLDWVACKEACVLGSDRVELTLTAGRPTGGGAGTDGLSKHFQEARSRIPIPLPGDEKLVRLTWKGRALDIEAVSANELVFYPRRDCTRLENLIRDGAAQGDRLKLRFEAEEGEPIRASGVLEVVAGRAGGSRFYSLNITRP